MVTLAACVLAKLEVDPSMHARDASADGADTGGSAGGTADSGNQAIPYTPKGNGKPISEADACKMLADAIESASEDVGKTEPCMVPIAPCPDLIRYSVPNGEQCLQYDEGSILGCVEFYHSFTTCEDFKIRN